MLSNVQYIMFLHYMEKEPTCIVQHGSRVHRDQLHLVKRQVSETPSWRNGTAVAHRHTPIWGGRGDCDVDSTNRELLQGRPCLSAGKVNINTQAIRVRQLNSVMSIHFTKGRGTPWGN